MKILWIEGVGEFTRRATIHLWLAVCISAALTTSQIYAAQSRGLSLTEMEKGSGLPKETQAMLDSLRKTVAHHAEVTELLARSQSFYRAGEAFYRYGDHSAAELNFLRARQIVADAEEEIFYEASVHAYFLKLNHEIAALKEAPAPLSVPGNQFQIDAKESVQTFVKYFQGKGQSVVRAAFARLELYEAMMRNIFREEDVPEELIYVGLVESAYNPYAQSAAGAKGIWQFILETGKRYELKQVGAFDERYDPEKSTRAAARYLRDLYELFGDWPLALAAYNAGEHRVLRVIEKTGIKSFWEMSIRKLLPEETMAYVPAVLAAISIGTQRAEHKFYNWLPN
ncbi:MAG: transglycosylase SLT domain-containing protein [Acidobacteria bacterium]|nr:transglycosylase SLT domain-containing protein [Acidobacteriota bacterium]